MSYDIVETYDITETGRNVLKLQDDASKTYGYHKIPDDTAIKYMRVYVSTLPDGFNLKEPSTPVNLNPEINRIYNDKPGFEIIKEEKIKLISRDFTLLADSWERIVIGHYGAFIEVKDGDMYKNSLKIKKGQEYRIKDPRYSEKVKYEWWTADDFSDCKLYKQKRTVSYADYRPGFWYISPFEVLSKGEILQWVECQRKSFQG